jgi:hypothetical protein
VHPGEELAAADEIDRSEGPAVNLPILDVLAVAVAAAA